jgi:translation initiation factor 2B subunit (eIF-2B alpha/beta/delta family)
MVVAALARDRKAGATELARRAARWLRVAARDDGKALARWQQEVRRAAVAVAAAQPAMASVLTVADLACRAAEGAPTAAVGARAVRAALDRYLARQPGALARAARRLPGRLPRAATCLTRSASEAVFRALLAARARGRLAAVVVGESRPGCEGLVLARRLAARGVPVTVVVDALAPAWAPGVDALVVGADAVTPSALWNKCGTLALGLAAAAAGRPLIVVTTEDRLVPAALARRLREPEAETAAVLRRPPRGVRAVNRLFDRTPLGLVATVLTEAGAFPPAAVRARLARRPAARWWARAAGPAAGAARRA